MPSDRKRRLDRLMVERGLASSRERARARIMAGQVLVAGRPQDKPGTLVDREAVIALRGEEPPFVSRGGLKLEAALRAWRIDPTGCTCLDVGASTGGFSDCLLQHGARHVYAVDVGYGQLAWKLRGDARVTVLERTNIRHLPPERIPEPIDLATVDVAFISLRLVIPVVQTFLRPGGRVVALVKPQFEVGRGQVGKGGIVHDPEQHRRVLERLCGFMDACGLTVTGTLPSPILGQKGNREFLMLVGT